MDTLIVTMHRGNNYGSALQTYALSEKIKELGHNPIVLDYIPERINNKKLLISLLKILFGINSIKTKYNALRSIAVLVSSQICYNKFFNRELRLTQRFYSIKELEKNIPDVDVYMTGSDQVWNSFHNKGIENVFYLSFAPNNKRKVAYAASFGRNNLENWEIKETKKLLSRYDIITVREQSGINILESIGFQESECVLDPTFLLTKDEWIKRANNSETKDKYILIYSVEPDKASVIKIAKAIAHKLKAKVYMVEWGHKPYPGVDKMISLVDPLKLIDYFLRAEFIVASSFHGTALSINLNKQFISISPARFNTRVESILNIIDEKERIISYDDFDINKVLTPINYVKVNKLLNIEREKSISILKQMFL